jgi:hypothetical protein
MVENLENIRKAGIQQFIQDEKVRWACPEGGGTICVHKRYCYSCRQKEQQTISLKQIERKGTAK